MVCCEWRIPLFFVLTASLAFAAASSSELYAESVQPEAPPSEVLASKPTDFRKWIETLWPEADAAHVSKATFDKIVKDLSPDCAQTGVACPAAPSGSSLTKPDPIQAPADRSGESETPKTNGALPESCNKVSQTEFLRPSDYFPRDDLRELVEQGQTLLYKWRTQQPGVYASVLTVQKNYGVDRHILMALWGRETSFGDVPDDHNAVRSLASLAYAGAPARRPWYREQLVAALKMLDEGHITYERFSSSYAGATGLTQIMPDEFLKYASDGDGDGHKDIWGSAPDSLATTANVLKHAGWSSDRLGWGYEIETRGDHPLDCTLEGKSLTLPIREWMSKYAVSRIRNRLTPRHQPNRGFPSRELDAPAYLVAPAGGRGPVFLVTQNFDVLKSYNPSELYALFVAHISDRLNCDTSKRFCEFKHPWPDEGADDFPFSVENLCRLQIGLKDRGFLKGEPDGLFGPQTRVAIGQYQKASGLKSDCYPTVAILRTLTASNPPDSVAGPSGVSQSTDPQLKE